MKFDYKKDYLALKLDGDLKEISDTKHAQELAVANKIIQLLNSNTYVSIDDFYNNNNNLQAFLKNHFETPLSHFSQNEPNIDENDYNNMIENFRIIAEKKRSIDANANTTKIDDKVYASMDIDSKTEIIDNTNYNATIEERMKNAQEGNSSLQTVNPKENAQNAFKEIQNGQESINPIPLSQVNYNSLTDEEKKMFEIAVEFQAKNNLTLRADFHNKIMVDENGKVYKLRMDENGLKIVSNENNGQEEEMKKEEVKENQYQKTLVMTNNSNISA